MIHIGHPDSHARLSRPALTRFLNRARQAVGLDGEVAVLLTSDAEIKTLNRTYRGKNKPTDVLSFPTPPEIAAKHSGDLAISLDTAARQAATFGHSLEIEIKVLILHGLLHLGGEDHETDSGEMAALEASLRTHLKLPISLIDRVTNPALSTPVKRNPDSLQKTQRPAKPTTPAQRASKVRPGSAGRQKPGSRQAAAKTTKVAPSKAKAIQAKPVQRDRA